MSSKPNHILFLTTANLPTNPRLVKELDLARQYYKVTVVLFKLGNWSDATDGEMRNARKDVNFVLLDATRQNFSYWLKWALMEKLSRLIRPFFTNNLFITALAHSRRSVQLRKALKKLSTPDLIVSHNLGALYPAWKASKKWNIPFIYDIEDYDPGIHVPQTGKRYKDYSETLMIKCLPHAIALTSASPLIGEYTLKLISGHSNHRVLLNSFPGVEFKPPKSNPIIPNPYNLSPNSYILKPKPYNLNPNSQNPEPAPHSFFKSPPWGDLGGPKLKLVWFSQHISFCRGLEQLFEALTILNTQLKAQNSKFKTHLTLIGHLDPKFDQQIIQPFLQTQTLNPNSQNLTPNSYNLNPITYTHLPPLTQPQLHAELRNHDIGLALESGKDFNNKLAISNKIIAYAQAGLYIMATDTPAQKQFMAENPKSGIICGQTPEEISEALKKIIEQKEAIQNTRKLRFEKGKELAWEKEAGKLEKMWKMILENR